MNDRVGQQFGKYRLSRLLGQGGFAEVYLGEHIYLKTQAALKLLHGRLSEQDTKEFLQEAQTLAKLKHPHIVRVYDFGLEQHIPYIVMDYAPNGTLHDRHPRGTMVPLPQILSYVRQVGTALAYTHECKLIHRDVKPENMLLDEQNQIQLSDFGIASIAHRTASMQLQTVTGTVRYMAPEQLLGLPTPASDQYSLGILVYEWLCGESPFHGATFVEIGMKHATAPVPSLQQKVPTLMPEVEQVVLKALAKDEKQRFLHIQDFVQALEKAALGSTTTFLIPALGTLPIQPAQAVELPPPVHPASLSGDQTVLALPIPGTAASALPRVEMILNPPRPATEPAPSLSTVSPVRQAQEVSPKPLQRKTADQVIAEQLQNRLEDWTPDQVCPSHINTKRCRFDQQGKMIELHFCKVELTQFPLEVGNLSSLQTLLLYDNQLTSLPAEIGNLTDLELLLLGKNRLTSLPAEIGNLTALQKLTMYSNQLTSLPAEIGNLTALQELHLSGNQLVSLPTEVGNFTLLHVLRVDYNQLTSLPAEIGNLADMKELWLNNNRLTTLPSELGNLTDLKELRLGGNPLHTPPPAIVQQGTEALLFYLRAMSKQSDIVSFQQDPPSNDMDEKEQQTRIEQAEQLLRSGQNRAAGAIAGVILESHLKILCDRHALAYSERGGLQLLIQTLQKKSVITEEEARNLTHLASIRNKCAHASSVSEEEVRLLVEEVKKFVEWVSKARNGDHVLQALVGQEAAKPAQPTRTDLLERAQKLLDQNFPATRGESRKTIASSPHSLTARPEAIKAFHTLKVHGGSSCHIALSADGLTLASGDDDGMIKLWNVQTGQLLHTLKTGKFLRILRDYAEEVRGETINAREEVRSVTFSADGQMLASSGTGKVIKLWNVQTGQLLHTLKGHTAMIQSVALSADGLTLASGGTDKTIKLWHIQTRRCFYTLEGYTAMIQSVALSADGLILASGGDNTIKLWNTQTGQLSHTFSHIMVRSVALSADGLILASGGDDSTIKLWNTQTGQLLRTLTGHTNDVKSVAVRADGLMLASGGDDSTIKLWNVQTGQLLRTLTGHTAMIQSVALSTDGLILASGDSHGTIKLWKVKK